MIMKPGIADTTSHVTTSASVCHQLPRCTIRSTLPRTAQLSSLPPSFSSKPRLRAAPRPTQGTEPEVEGSANWLSNQTGTDEPMQVIFRECNTYRLWIWLELYNDPTHLEKDTLDAVLTAWFTLGRCGGFNAQNLQVFYQGEGELSEFPYEVEPAKSALDSTFHDFGEFETRGHWCRSWVNMGTADEFSMDILINALTTVSKESIGIRSLLLGGDNPDWPAPRGQQPKRQDLNFAGMDLQDY